VIGDCSVDAVAHSRQESHQPPDAVAQDANLASALRKLGHGVDGVLNVLGTGVSVVGLIEAKTRTTTAGAGAVFGRAI
jgi:hypothetical protein